MNEKRVLVVAAHPDDEVLGCGGTVRKWRDCGAQTYALILAQGIAARGEEAGDSLNKEIETLRANAKAAANIAGYHEIMFEIFRIIGWIAWTYSILPALWSDILKITSRRLS